MQLILADMVDTKFLEDHEGLHYDPCCYNLTLDGTDDRWLLNQELVASTAATEKVLEVVHGITFRAETLAIPEAPVKSDIYRPEVMKTIKDEIDRLSPRLRDLSLKIHGKVASTVLIFMALKVVSVGHPELKFREQCAIDILSARSDTDPPFDSGSPMTRLVTS